MGSGFESQGAHIKKDPADSSESAGFLRSLINTVLSCEVHIILFASGFDAWKTVFALVPTGDLSSQSSDTLMSLRAIPSFSLGYLVLRQRIYAPLRVSVFGVRCGPAGVAVDSRGFRVRPVPSELGWGRLSPFSVLRGGWCFACRHTKARHRHTTAAGNQFKKS